MRDVALDRVRGLAIVIMMFDHVLAIMDPVSIWRYTFTRAALPLFCVVAGVLVKSQVSWARVCQVCLWGLLLSWSGVGFGKPDILLLLGASIVIASLWPSPWWVILGAVQSYNWRVGGSGYEPGYILALVMIGLFCRDQFRGSLQVFGGALSHLFGRIGRYPLGWYVGHIIFLRCVQYAYRTV